jgi:type IV pilus assembly protein PilX
MKLRRQAWVRRTRTAPAEQRGVALVAVMLMTLIVFGLGISLAMTSSLGSRVAANARDRQLAFEAAQAALRDAQAALSARADAEPLRSSAFTADCPDARCASTPGNPIWPRLSESDWEGSRTLAYGALTGAPPLSGLSRPPRVIIEFQGTVQGIQPGQPCEALFLVTASARGASTRARVLLQMTYRQRVAECYALV